MYQDPNMLASIRKVEAAREENIKLDPRRMTADEKDALLKKFHPDYRTEQFTELRFGPNKGQKVPLELADLLEGESRVLHEQFDLTKPDYETDVLIIGGGGAGCSAAIEADKAGAKVMVVTKLRMGDANTMMAEGGIQAADKPNDSPAQHFLDAYGGGHFAAQKDLLYKLVMDAPEAIQWLSGLGVEFDKAPDGTMITTHGGGTSRKRMHAAKDYSGAEIMRTLRDEVLNRGIPVVDFTSAIELIKDENGHCAGAILLNMETKELLVAKAKTVILATGGAGRLHYQGFPTSSCPRLPRGREAPLPRHAAVSSHGRGLPRADLRRAGHGEGPLCRRDARERGRRGLYEPARDARRGRGLHHPRVHRARQGCQDPGRAGRLARHADDRAEKRQGHDRKADPGHDAHVCQARHRHPHRADPRLPDAPLPERRSAHHPRRPDRTCLRQARSSAASTGATA